MGKIPQSRYTKNMAYPFYVLHVKKGYEDREQSIIRQFSSLGLSFEWILDYDIADINPEVLSSYRYRGTKLRPGEISCCLKHIVAWEKIAAGEEVGSFVFEDDVLIKQKKFTSVITAAIADLQLLADGSGYLSLSDGSAMYVPWTKLRPGRYLYPANQVRTSDSYFLNRTAARLMLQLLAREGFFLPADHLINRLCHEADIPIFWLEPTVVSQGSHTGSFSSSLQTYGHGGMKDKIMWVVKKIRRKYVYPLFGIDPRKISVKQRQSWRLSTDK